MHLRNLKVIRRYKNSNDWELSNELDFAGWFEKRRAEKDFLVLCMLDKWPLMWLSGTTFLLCTGAVVSWSFVIAYELDFS